MRLALLLMLPVLAAADGHKDRPYFPELYDTLRSDALVAFELEEERVFQMHFSEDAKRQAIEWAEKDHAETLASFDVDRHVREREWKLSKMESVGYYRRHYEPFQSSGWSNHWPKSDAGNVVAVDDITGKRFTFTPVAGELLGQNLVTAGVVERPNPDYMHSTAFFHGDLEGIDVWIEEQSWQTEPTAMKWHVPKPYGNVHGRDDPGSLDVWKSTDRKHGKTEVVLVTNGKRYLIEVYEALRGEKLSRLRRFVQRLY